MSAWQLGGPGLQRPLDKLLGTWSGVFPSPLLADIQGRVAALRAAQAPQHVQPAAVPLPVNGSGSTPSFGYGALVPAPAFAPPPMAADPRLAQQSVAPYPHQPVATYAQQAAAYTAVLPPQPSYQQPPSQYQQTSAVALAQAAQPAAPQVDVNGLLASLLDSGLLAAPGAQPSAAATTAELLPHQGSGALATPQHVAATTPPHALAARATPEREQPASTRFTPDRIKVQTGSHHFLYEQPLSTILRCAFSMAHPVSPQPCMHSAGSARRGAHARGVQAVRSQLASGLARAEVHCYECLRAARDLVTGHSRTCWLAGPEPVWEGSVRGLMRHGGNKGA
jgi:hypothetical protein